LNNFIIFVLFIEILNGNDYARREILERFGFKAPDGK
jgi:hypothetical protein